MAKVQANGEVVLPLASRGTSGNTGPLGRSGEFSHILVVVHASAVSGTSPTLDCAIEQSGDGSSFSAVTGGAMTQLTAAGNRVFTAAVTDDFVRVAYTIGGSASPTVTFQLSVFYV